MKLLFIIICTFFFFNLSGQAVGINANGLPPHAGAILDVNSDEKGVLLPRTLTTSIVNPIEGMVIYDTVSQDFQYFNGMQWLALLQEGSYSFWWADQDGDGFGYPFNVIYAPEAPGFYVGNNSDCDDNNELINASAPEVCDGIDNNCNDMVDEGNPGGGAACGSNVGTCQQGVLTCIDGELVCVGEVGPQPEICDGLDNDCDGDTDEDAGSLWYIDADNDGYGDDMATPIQSCAQPNGSVGNNFDCNDASSSINPEAQEVCDGLDNDCDGEIDEGLFCDDGIPCTIDQCVGGTCESTIAPGKCLINGVCYDEGEQSPGNVCLQCNPNISTTTWTPVPGLPCPGEGICDATGNCIQ